MILSRAAAAGEHRRHHHRQFAVVSDDDERHDQDQEEEDDEEDEEASNDSDTFGKHLVSASSNLQVSRPPKPPAPAVIDVYTVTKAAKLTKKSRKSKTSLEAASGGSLSLGGQAKASKKLVAARDRDYLNNSEDEYESRSVSAFPVPSNDSAQHQQHQQLMLDNSNEHYAAETIEELEAKFRKMIKDKKGYIIKPMKEDGACLFRAVADQIYGDQEMHSTVRYNCMDYITKNADYFKQYMTEDIDRYVSRKREDTCHGNHIEIIAIAEIYNRPIEVFEYSCEPKNTFQSVFQTDNEPIRLSYHGRNHYNSVVDPYKATIGVGLGLPQLTPGLAEKNLMNDAIKKSEEFHIEQAMLDDKLKATDWEATNDEIMELVARESYIQWLKDNEKRHNFLHTDTSHLTTTTMTTRSPSSATCSAWDHEPALASRAKPLSRRSAAAMSTPPHSPSQTKFSHHHHQHHHNHHLYKTSPSQSKSDKKLQQQQQHQHQHAAIYEDPYSGPSMISFGAAGVDKPTSSKSSSSVKYTTPTPTTLTSPNLPHGTSNTAASTASLISQDIYDESMPLAYQFYETKSIMNELPPDLFGLGSSEWTSEEPATDSDILASVLAASQQEYLESLKAKRQQQS